MLRASEYHNMCASQVHLTTLVILIIHTVSEVGGGVRVAAITSTRFAGGGSQAMGQRLLPELNHLTVEDPNFPSTGQRL